MACPSLLRHPAAQLDHHLKACLSHLLAVCPSLHPKACHSLLWAVLALVPAPVSLHLECPCRTTQDANRMAAGISTHATHIRSSKRPHKTHECIRKRMYSQRTQPTVYKRMPHISNRPGRCTQQKPRGNGTLALTRDSDRTQAEEVESEDADYG
jgi:hypothetical protein